MNLDAAQAIDGGTVGGLGQRPCDEDLLGPSAGDGPDAGQTRGLASQPMHPPPPPAAGRVGGTRSPRSKIHTEVSSGRVGDARRPSEVAELPLQPSGQGRGRGDNRGLARLDAATKNVNDLVVEDLDGARQLGGHLGDGTLGGCRDIVHIHVDNCIRHLITITCWGRESRLRAEQHHDAVQGLDDEDLGERHGEPTTSKNSVIGDQRPSERAVHGERPRRGVRVEGDAQQDQREAQPSGAMPQRHAADRLEEG